jgi:hypothetical protein
MVYVYDRLPEPCAYLVKQAQKDYEAALSIRKQLVLDFPNQPDLRNDLAGSYSNQALLHLRNYSVAKQLLLVGRVSHPFRPRRPNRQAPPRAAPSVEQVTNPVIDVYRQMVQGGCR